jgi:hypothetical protein
MRKGNGEAGRKRSCWNLGVASRKEVEHAINIRGVADVAQFHVEIEKTVEVIHFNGKCWSIGEMVNEGVDLTEVHGVGKISFHVRLESLVKKVCFLS